MLARLLRDLAPFTPSIIGTFPLGLQVDGSDLDIACSCDDLDRFEGALRASLTGLAVPIQRMHRARLTPEASVTSFAWDQLAIEVFCQPLRVDQQRGFRHMVIEGQLLVIGGSALRERVHQRKRAGVKTEPAFAEVLGLTGDPYLALLELERWPPDRLARLVDAALCAPG